MVMAKLHIICGNCGCNDMLTFTVDPKGSDYSDEHGERFGPSVRITCGNCSTVHCLEDTIEEVDIT